MVPQCRIPGSVPLSFGGLRPVSVKVEGEGSPEPQQSFLTMLFDQSRVFPIVRKISGAVKQANFKKIDSKFSHCGVEYTLLATTVHKDQGAFSKYGKTRYAEYYYIATSGGGVDPIDLQRELERIADFGSIPSVGKLASRLELLRSPSIPNRPPCTIHIDDIKIIDDVVNEHGDLMAEGCGFISDEMIEQLLGGKAQKHLAMQVRIEAPQLGIFKGMLCRKPGIKGIQLTLSMRKVGASKIAQKSETWAVIVRNDCTLKQFKKKRVYVRTYIYIFFE